MRAAARSADIPQIASDIVALAVRAVHGRLAGLRPEPGAPEVVATSIVVWREGRIDPGLSADSPGPVRPGWMVVEPLVAVDGVLAARLAGEGAVAPALTDALHESAPVVTSAVLSAEQLRGLVAVPETRLVIEQAKGMVMAYRGVGADEAFSLLRRLSQHLNIPVRDLARDVVSRGVPEALDASLAGAAPVPRV